MKVLAINGSPRKNGNTSHALKLSMDVLNSHGIETDIIHIGNKAISGCIACNACRKTGVCSIADDDYTSWVEKLYNADGVIIGTPVYYASMSGTLKSFLDRAFYGSKGRMRFKVGASIAIPRRTGGMPAFNEINNYFLISEMIIAPSTYWNVGHGALEGEILKDTEAISTFKTMANNMVWLLKMKDFTKDKIELPESVKKDWLNFIR